MDARGTGQLLREQTRRLALTHPLPHEQLVQSLALCILCVIIIEGLDNALLFLSATAHPLEVVLHGGVVGSLHIILQLICNYII